MSQMDGIQQQSFMDPEQCCLRIFDGWIISNGESTDYPITWSGLHKLLLDAGLGALAEQLRTAVGIDIPMQVKSDKATEKVLVCVRELLASHDFCMSPLTALIHPRKACIILLTVLTAFIGIFPHRVSRDGLCTVVIRMCCGTSFPVHCNSQGQLVYPT